MLDSRNRMNYIVPMRKSFLLFPFILIFLFTSVQGEVIDRAKIFSPDTIQTADAKITEIKQKTGKDFIFETVENLGGKNASDLALMNARERAVNGIYILVALQERKIEIKVGSATGRLFGTREREALRTNISREFKGRNYDSGLISAVDYAGEVFLAGKTGGAGASPGSSILGEGSSLPSWLPVVLLVVGGFILFRIIRNLMNRNSQPGYQNPNSMQPGQGGMMNQGGMMGGGSGIFGSILGGVFGAMAGSWIYDRMTGHDSGLSAASHSDSSVGNDSDSWSNRDDGTNYSGDSGGWDGGGDSGGDSGGGDFGGGDF